PDRARYLGLCERGRGISGARPPDAEDRLGVAFRASPHAFAVARTVCDGRAELVAAFQYRPTLAESPAGRSRDSRISGRTPDAEESRIEPAGRAFYRACSRCREIDGAATANSQVVRAIRVARHDRRARAYLARCEVTPD